MITRREFVAGVSAFLLARFDRTRPSLILHNGNIFTVERDAPRARAVGIADGRFVAVGTDDDVLALAVAGTKKIDLGGKTVVPGFIDAHTHPAEAGLEHLRSVDCDLRSIGAIQAALRERAAKTRPGEWVLGFKYDDTKTSEGRWLSARDLDAVSTRHPIYVQHRGGHTAYVNSAALARAGITEGKPDPAGGHFHRDGSGKLSGRLEERATEGFQLPNDVSLEQRRKGIALISKMMTRAGVTSVHDAYASPEMLRAYREAHASGELAMRVYCLMDSACLDRMIAAGIATGFGDEWVRVGAQKQTCDGSISERTARLRRPYQDRPDYFGIVVTEERELYERARKAHAAGWQNAIHANGDAGIDIALRVYERLQKELPRRDARWRLEHCTVIDDALIARMRALGVIPNPFSTYVYYHGEKMKAYGSERLESMFAVRSFLDAGLRPTMTSDYPPGPFEPMMALQSMVTRTDWQGTVWGARQRATVEEALRVGTLHGAYASFEENLKGSIRAGKLADLVVLGEDPTRVDSTRLIKIPVERTMIGGRWVFEA